MSLERRRKNIFRIEDTVVAAASVLAPTKHLFHHDNAFPRTKKLFFETMPKTTDFLESRWLRSGVGVVPSDGLKTNGEVNLTTKYKVTSLP